MNQPHYPPTSFAANWRKLSDELKLKVLHYAVPINETFSEFTFKKRKQIFTLDQRIVRRDVLPLLACSEIANLALEVLYVPGLIADAHSVRAVEDIVDEALKLRDGGEKGKERYHRLGWSGAEGGGGRSRQPARSDGSL
jgi:hypothetical protein